MIYHGNRECDSLGFNQRPQKISVLFQNLFGVIQERVKEFFGQDDGGCKYRTRKTAAARFITSSFQQFVLEFCLQQWVLFSKIGLGYYPKQKIYAPRASEAADIFLP